MRIRYTGTATVREWERGGVTYRWDPENRHTLEIADAEFAQDLLTHPPGDFAVAADDDVAAALGLADLTAELSLAGVVSLEQLAALEDDAVMRVAEQLGTDAAQVQRWRDNALTQLRRAEAERSLETAEPVVDVEVAEDDEDDERD